MQRYYKYVYRFHASHSLDYEIAHAHPHTFSITLYVSSQAETDTLLFSEVDVILHDYLKPYEHCYLNDLPAFATQLPNLENLGDTFFDALRDRLLMHDIQLYQLDISENPLNTYQVSSRIHIPAAYQSLINKDA